MNSMMPGGKRAVVGSLLGCAAMMGVVLPEQAQAQAQSATQVPPRIEKTEDVAGQDRLDEIVVNGQRSQTLSIPVESIGQSIGRAKLDSTNIVTTDDALRYVPNLIVRRRFAGDINASVAIRGTNTTQAARTLVLIDGIPLSNFLGGDSSFAPRWGLVAPDEIQSIDVMYGPYSAEYGGNTIGAGIFITSRMPDKLEVSANVLGGLHTFKRYATDQDLYTWQGQASIGDRIGNVAFAAFLDHLDAVGHTINFQVVPVSTGSTTLRGTPVTGGIRDTDYLGVDRWFVGALGPATTRQTTAKGKMAWDIDTDTRLFAMLAYRDFRQTSLHPEAYLRDAAGNPVLTGRVQLADRSYDLSTLPNLQRSIVNLEDVLAGATFQKRLGTGLTAELRGSFYEILRGDTRNNLANESRPRVNRTGDTGWRTGAATLTWRDAARPALLGQKLVVGGDYNYYFGANTIFTSPDWRAGTTGNVVESGRGRTETWGLFGENTWALGSGLSLILGTRWDNWRAFDGARGVAAQTIAFPGRSADAWSPKATLTWAPDDDWTVTGQAARATRFATVQELFQTISSAGQLIQSDPDLAPERATTFALSAARKIRLLGGAGKVSAALFHDTVRDALYLLSNVTVNAAFYQNVEKVRTRGIDASLNIAGMGDGLVDLYLNVTHQRGTTVVNQLLPASNGKDFPRVPRWRGNMLATVHPTDRLATSLGLRYEGNQYNEFLNAGSFAGGYGAASRFLMADAKIAYALTDRVQATIGVDNLFDYAAYIGHPYAGRTFLATLRFRQ